MKKILLSISAIVAVTTLNAQNYFSDDFEDVPVNGTNWNVYDADGDGNNWGIYDFSASTTAPHLNSLSYAAGSESWDGTNGLTPDNLFISPVIDLSTASGTVTLTWDVASVEDAGSSYAGEYYAVYAVTDPNSFVTATPVFTETIADGGQIYTQTADLSSMAGQATVYLIWRHYQTSDMNMMVVDNISVDGSGTSGLTESTIEVNAYPNPASTVLNIVTTSNATSVSVITMDGKVVATENVSGTTASINVADLVSGVYFYEVTAQDGSVVRNTFVKK